MHIGGLRDRVRKGALELPQHLVELSVQALLLLSFASRSRVRIIPWPPGGVKRTGGASGRRSQAFLSTAMDPRAGGRGAPGQKTRTLRTRKWRWRRPAESRWRIAPLLRS